VLAHQHGPEVLYAFWGAIAARRDFRRSSRSLTPKLDAERYYASVRDLVALSEVRAVVTYGEMLPALRARLDGFPTLAAILDAVDDLDASRAPRPVLRARPIAARRHSFLQPLVRLDRPAKRRDALTRRGAEPDRRLQRRESV